MSVMAIVGAQWGDEGKGKIIDELADRADYVVRYQGGGNAGHRVLYGEKEFAFHLVPAGILHDRHLHHRQRRRGGPARAAHGDGDLRQLGVDLLGSSSASAPTSSCPITSCWTGSRKRAAAWNDRHGAARHRSRLR